VWVVVDGSTDGTAQGLQRMAEQDPGPAGVSCCRTTRARARRCCTGWSRRRPGLHACADDGRDGQHPAALIPAFMQAQRERPEVMVLGRPVFDASAPLLRVRGRKVSNAWTNLETLGAGVADSLYGFRVYPVDELLQVMRGQRWMRRFDFDTEAVVRLAWRGVKPVNVDAPVKYLRPTKAASRTSATAATTCC
jgi:hypothetical protein